MKKILLIIIAILPSMLFAQGFRVSGTVIDGQTQQPLAGASVFCQNTTVGTITNSNGEFSMTLPPGGYDIVVSFTGYETQSQNINAQTDNITQLRFVLKEKSKNMEEVAVVATTEVKNGWEKYGDFFKEQFIGLTENSALCNIENPTALRFFFSKKKNRLKVIASEDLIITNKALGYKIRYTLDSFTHEYASSITQFTGYPLFEEMQGSAEEQQRWNEKREEAYLGSVTHFMKSYYEKTLGQEGYRVEFIDPKTNKSKPLNDPYDSAFSVVDGEELELHPPAALRITYLNETPEQKYLIKNKLALTNTVQISQVNFRDAVGVERNGYFYDQRDLLALGYWGWEKIADLMPYNYSPK
jgi:hypothetical protein